MECSRLDFLDKVDYSIEKEGSDINSCIEKSTISALRALLEEKSDAFDLNKCLDFAVQIGRVEALPPLIDYGAPINGLHEDGAPLRTAILHRHIEVVKYLVEIGANVDAVDAKNRSILHHLSMKRQTICIWYKPITFSYFISHVSDVNPKDYKGNTPLHYTALNNKPILATSLLSAKADINSQNNDGETPLMIAVRKRFELMVKLLLNSGADRRIKNKNGNTAKDISKQVFKKSGYRRYYDDYDTKQRYAESRLNTSEYSIFKSLNSKHNDRSPSCVLS